MVRVREVIIHTFILAGGLVLLGKIRKLWLKVSVSRVMHQAAFFKVKPIMIFLFIL